MGQLTKNNFAYGFQIIAVLILFSYSPFISKDEPKGISQVKKTTVHRIKSVPGIDNISNSYSGKDGHLITRHIGQQLKKEDAVNLSQYSQPDLSIIFNNTIKNGYTK